MKRLLIAAATVVVVIALLIADAYQPAVSVYGLKPANILLMQTPHGLVHRPERIRVVTYNIGYASGAKNNRAILLDEGEVRENLRAMAKALKGLDADIIGLQEVDFRSQRTFGINQLGYLAKALEMPYVAYTVTWNKRYVAWPYWPVHTQFGAIVSGQAVLSRFPIRNQHMTVFPKPNANPFWYNWFYLDRVVQELEIELDHATRATLWHVHLEAFHAETRLDEAHSLGEIVKKKDAAMKLVLGDFNSVSRLKEDLSIAEKRQVEDRGEALQAVRESASLTDAHHESDLLSMPSWAPVKKIDHILYAGPLAVVGGGTVPMLTASDHLPIYADFILTGTSGNSVPSSRAERSEAWRSNETRWIATSLRSSQ